MACHHVVDVPMLWPLVDSDGNFYEQVPLTNKARLTSVSMMFPAMLIHALQDCDDGNSINYHTHDKLFNLRRWRAKAKVQRWMMGELLSEDEMTTLNASIERKLPEGGHHVLQACDNSQSAPRRPRLSANCTWKAVQWAVQWACHPRERNKNCKLLTNSKFWEHSVKSCADWW